MTILTSIILIVAIIAIALFIAYNVQKGTKTLQEFKADYFNNEEVQEVADLAKELYNKDLRPTVAKKAPKKEKVVKEVETIAEVITPEVVEKVVEVAKVTPEVTTVNVEAVVEAIKPKKKRKYYPRKK